jgi:hypothetical protein
LPALKHLPPHKFEKKIKKNQETALPALGLLSPHKV